MSLAPHVRIAPARLPYGLGELRVLSIHHGIASIDELERMAVSEAALSRLHQGFREDGLEAVVLSTCNRTELYSYALRPGDHERSERLLMDAVGREAPERAHFAEARGLEAAAHLFRVAAGLESLVMGEAEVLGQVRVAIQAAEAAGVAGFFLSGLFRAALRSGGRARSETAIGGGALSVASAAVQLLARVHRDLPACTVMVLGTGVTGLKAARRLKAERVGRLVLANRTPRRAEEAAVELGAEAVTLEDVPRLLEHIDAVVAATQAEQPLLTAPMLRAARAQARDPLVLIDLSLPRTIDPECGRLDGVLLHDLSGLEEIVAHNRARREHEVPRVAALLDQELRIFATQARESTVRPLVAELRQRAEAIRLEEIGRGLDDGLRDGALLERVTRRIVDRLLHAPSTALRRGDVALDEQHARYLRMMFGLETEPPDAQRGHR